MSSQDKINVAITCVIVPLFVWIWHTNTAVASLELRLKSSEQEIENMSDNGVDIQLIKKDIEYMKQTLDKIHKKVQEK